MGEVSLDQIKALHEIHPGLAGIMIKNEFHIIGGDKHLKFNKESRKFQVMHLFPHCLNIPGIYNHGLSQTKNKLLMFGGSHIDDCFDAIRKYDIMRNSWITLPNQMPQSDG